MGYSGSPSSLRTTTYTGYTYSSDSPTSLVSNSDQTVYRLFTANTYTIAYSANLSTGDRGTRPGNQTKTYNVALTLSTYVPTRYCTVTYDSNGGSSATAEDSYFSSFVSWNTAQDGSGTSYQSGGSYTANAAATLYAQWSGQYATVTLPTVTKADSIFKGWYTEASGGTRVGGAGSTYRPTASITLHAQWDSGVVRIYHGSSFTTYIPYIYKNGAWVSAIPYVYKSGSWKVSV